MRVLQRWNRPLVITPEIRAFLKEPTLLIVTKSAVRSRVHRRVYMDYIGVKRFDATRHAGRRVPHRRPVHLDRLYALDALDPLSAPQGRRRRCGAPASIPTAIPARRWSTCWRPIRATSCSRSTRTRSSTSRWRSCSSTSGRACACCRGATASTASSRSSSIVPRDRYDSARARARSATIWPAPINGRVSAFYPFFPEGPLVRVHFIIGRARRRDARSRPRRRSKPRSAAIVRTWTDELARGARARRTSRPRRARCSRAIATPSPTAIARPIRRRPRSPTSGSSRDCRPSRPLGVDFHRRVGRGRRQQSASRSGATAGRSRCRSACRCWRTWASGGRRAHLPDRAGRATTSPTSGSTTWRSSAPTAPRSTSTARKQRLEAAFLVVMTRRRRERRLQRARARRPG